MNKTVKKIRVHFQRNLGLYAITIFSLIIHLIYRTPYLEDWDSVQFALGLHQYSVVLHQPHPPGYPIYILFGKFIYLFTGSDVQALTFLSALFGSLAIIPLFFLTKKMFGQTTAYITSIIFLLLPIEWILSEVANSNMTGLFFTLILAYLIYSWSNSLTHFKTAFLGALAAFALGIRFTDFPVIVALLGIFIIKIHSWKYSLSLLMSFTIGISLWLIPLLLITGPKKFYDAYREVANYVTWHDTLLGQSYTFKHLMKVRVEYLWELLNIAYTQIFILLSISSLIIFCLRKEIRRQYYFSFLLIWFFSYLIPLIFFYNLELPQYTLPLLPPLVIINAYIIRSLIKNRAILFLSVFIFSVFLFFHTFPQVRNQSKDIPPTITPIIYVQKNFDPENTLLITTFIYRQFQYYAPEYKNFYGTENLPKQIDKKSVIIDYEGLKRNLPVLEKYKIKSSLIFNQDHLLKFPRLKETKLYILQKI